jgi:cytochrome P450
VLVSYASANRDPLEWDAPDTFDIRRDAARQLGFGHGTRGRAGQGLARLETAAMFRARPNASTGSSWPGRRIGR